MWAWARAWGVGQKGLGGTKVRYSSREEWIGIGWRTALGPGGKGWRRGDDFLLSTYVVLLVHELVCMYLG